MNRLVQKIKLKLKQKAVFDLYTPYFHHRILFPFNVNRLPIQASVLGSALEPNLSPYGQDLIYLGISAFLICIMQTIQYQLTNSVSVIMKINEKNVIIVLSVLGLY